MKQKIKFEGSLDGEIDLDLKINIKDKKFIKCLTGFVNEANSSAGRIYVNHNFVGHKVVILVEEK